MSEILIRRTHHVSEQQARDGAEKVAEKLAQQFGLHYQWDADVLRFQRTGVSGALAVNDTELEIRVRLGFLLAPLAPRVEQEIHRYLDENFGRD